MPQANWVILLHFFLLWGGVITGLAADWRIGIPLAIAIPLGFVLWAAGFLYNLAIRRRRGRSASRPALARLSRLRIAARSLMNLGVALGSTSWLSLISAALLVPLYIAAAHRRERYLDYLRTGMMSDAFPERIVRH